MINVFKNITIHTAGGFWAKKCNPSVKTLYLNGLIHPTITVKS